MLSGKITLGFIPCHLMWREVMRPLLDAVDHQWRDMAIIPVRLNHHLAVAGMEVVPPRATDSGVSEKTSIPQYSIYPLDSIIPTQPSGIVLPLESLHPGEDGASKMQRRAGVERVRN